MTPADIAVARELGTATLHEAGGRIGALRSDIGPINPDMRLAGPAYPVATQPGHNLWIHRAVYSSRPGDILVVATGDGVAEWGYWGEILSLAASERGLGGLVLEGGSRDHAQLFADEFPVFSLGPCIRGTGKEADARLGPGAVEIGGQTIAPGDLVVGDRDGVVVIPQADVASIVASGQDRERSERAVMEQLRAGGTTLTLFGFDDINSG